MKALLFATSLLVVGSAWAQQQAPTVEQRLEETLGKLMFQNTMLATERDRLVVENAQLKEKLNELDKKLKGVTNAK